MKVNEFTIYHLQFTIGLHDLDLDSDSSWDIDPLKELECLRSRIHDVDETLMTADLELFTSVFIDESRTIESDLLDLRRKWNWSDDDSTTILGGRDDLRDCLIDEFMLECLYYDTDLIRRFFGLFSSHGF